MPTQLTLAQRAEQSLTLKAGDRKPLLQAALRRGRVRDSAVDLTEAVEIRLYLQNDETGDLLVNQPMDVVDVENGIVEYEFGSGDTVQGGRNELEIVVTWPDDRPETFPKRGYGVMQVSEPLDRELDPADLDDADISVTILRADELRANTNPHVSVEDDLQFNGNDATGIGSLDTEETHTKTIATGEVHYAGDYDGETPDERLDNALAAVDDGHVIRLEAATYDADRSGVGDFDTNVILIGSKRRTEITSDWHLNTGHMEFYGSFINGGDLSINEDWAFIKNLQTSSTTDIIANADNVLLGFIAGSGSVVFESNTSDGEIGIVTGGTSVTDNGNNRVL